MSYFIYLVVCIFLNRASIAAGKVECSTEFLEWPNKDYPKESPRNETTIDCWYFGKENTPLDEFIRNTPHVSFGRNFTFDELASSIKIIRFYWIEGNVTISENGFKDLSNLEYLTLESAPTANLTPEYYLKISPQEFANTPNLKSLRIHQLAFTDDSVKALRHLRNQIQSLTLRFSSPQTKLLHEAAQFTNLTYRVDFSGMCDDEPFPESTFRKSAATIRSIAIMKCDLPKITRDLFSGMTNLWHLLWQRSNIASIEEGAFDELPNLQILDLNHNKIKNLPDGLFNQTKKLRRVELYGEVIENLTRDNFTHCAEFEQLGVRTAAQK